MEKDKYQVTVKGWVKLLVAIAFFMFSWNIFSNNEKGSDVAGISMIVYSLLFVYLAVTGSNGKAAMWISNTDLFSKIFLMPTIICAFYSAFVYASESCVLSAFGVLLTILSIPFALILIKVQGGIRRWDTLIAFVVLPLSIYLFGNIFDAQILAVAGAATILVLLVFVINSVIMHSLDHRADFNAADDKSDSRGYKARWDGRPDSDVRDNIIHLRGTIIVEYSGELFEDKARLVANDLIKQYALHVAREMPGYSINDTDVTVECRRVG